LLTGRVKFRISRVPSGNDVSVGMNVPEADISLVTRSNASVLSNVRVSILTGSEIVNLIY
jgi:methyl coenzyme M reductase subunit C-like uncharacterized protein (methanogenesis marker protein 7)